MLSLPPNPPNLNVPLIDIPIEQDKVNGKYRVVKGQWTGPLTNRYKATKEMRRASGYGRLDSRRRWQLLPNPWKYLFYKVWVRMDKIFKGEPEYSVEFRLYFFELVWSYVEYRRSIENTDVKDTMVDVKFRDIDKWRSLLGKAAQISERKRKSNRNLAIATAVLGTIEEQITDPVLKDRIKAVLIERLEQALQTQD